MSNTKELPPADQCSIFCECCGDAFVVLKRKTTDSDTYVCSMCREAEPNRNFPDDTFEYFEADDYWN